MGSPDLDPSDYHLFSLMSHALPMKHFNNYEDIGKWVEEWTTRKDEQFFWEGIHNLPEAWEKCVDSDGVYFE